MHTNWDDLRFILSVATHGSVSAGARALGVNHSTVLRRISAYEDSRDVQVFVRRQSGYQLTEAGMELLRVLRSVDSQFAELERKLAGRDLKLQGRVRITTTDSIALASVNAHVAAMVERFPLMEPELAVTNGHLDFSRRAADVSVRPCVRPPDDLVGVNVCPLGFRIYASTAYLAQHASRSLDEHAWVAQLPSMSQTPPSVWLRDNVPDARIVLRADSFVSLARAAASGAGVVLMPACLEPLYPELVRLEAPPVDVGVGVWVLTHRDLQRAATVRACADFLAERLKADEPLYAGTD